MKRILFLFITAMLFSTASVFAQGGTTGPLTWKISNDTLFISGNGTMPDYTVSSSGCPYTPWLNGGIGSHCSTIIIGDGVTRIGNFAFGCMTKVPSIEIPSSVTSIGWGALTESGLKTIIIPNSVTSIESYAFSTCTNLTSITLPNNLTSIGERILSYCSALTSVTNLNPIPVAINSNVFWATNISACTLYVPKNSVSAYQNADVWKNFNIVGIEVGVPIIEESLVVIYPNPTTGKIYLETESDIKLYNQQGRLLQETFTNQLDLSNYPQGVYLLQVNGSWNKVIKL